MFVTCKGSIINFHDLDNYFYKKQNSDYFFLFFKPYFPPQILTKLADKLARMIENGLGYCKFCETLL